VAYQRTFREVDAATGAAHVGVVELAVSGDAIAVTLPASATAVAPSILARVRRLLDLDGDTTARRSALEGDPDLGGLVELHPDVRVPGAWDGFECAVRTIVGQQVSVRGAATLIGRIVERCGQMLHADSPHGPSRVFPTPAQLAAADLGGLGLIQRRLDTLKALALAVDSGEIVVAPGVDFVELRRRLEALPGIGAWTAHYVSLRLGDPDAFPASDLGLLRALDPTRRLSPRELERRAERWRPHRAYAAQLLWRHDAAMLRRSADAAT
jgi:AraC family transcriptional regulator of adaptative response / DNA-3-methyladenine glycosylase II